MYTEQRVIWDTTEISKDVNDFRSGTAPFVYTTGGYLYVASILPFNNLWVDMGTANTNPANISIDILKTTNGTWEPAVDIIDETSGMTLSGRIQWNVNVDKSNWILQYKSEEIPELSTFKIYNMYWLRMSWDANFSASTSIDYIGQKFSGDNELFSFYPDLQLSNLMTDFAAGKTDWQEQHYMAAEHIVRDLRKRNIIKSRSQILDHTLFTDASCHKVAEIVYTAFGQPYFEQREVASKLYRDALDVEFANIDRNADGRLDPVERVLGTRWMTR